MAKYICLILILFINLFQVIGLNPEKKGLPIISTIYCMAVIKGNTQLLNISKETSELKYDEEFSEKQNERKINEENDSKNKLIVKIVSFGLIIAIILIILGFIWVWYLYLQIKKKTSEAAIFISYINF